MPLQPTAPEASESRPRGGGELSMSKKSSTNDISVIVPYRDFENLLNCSKKIEEMERRCKRMEERYAAMHLMYVELLEKIAEIDRYL